MSESKNPASVDALARLLAEITGRPLVAIRSMASNLREAGMLPDDRGPITADHAANLLVAAVAASAASEAVEAVRLVGGMPLARQDHITALADGRAAVSTTIAADIRVPPGCGSEWARLTRSLVGAVSYFIECARDQKAEASPNFLNVHRSRVAPTATIEIDLPTNDGSRALLWLHFGLDENEHMTAYAIAALRMAVSAIAPGLLFRLVGDLLAGRHSEMAGVITAPLAVPAEAGAEAK